MYGGPSIIVASVDGLLTALDAVSVRSLRMRRGWRLDGLIRS